MGKYIVELKKNETLYKAATRESDGTAYVCSAIGTPYTAPDIEQVRKEAYQKGYETGYKDGYNEPGKGKIQVGDEVENTQTGVRFIVTHTWFNNHGEKGVSGFNHDCSSFSTTIELVKKTGRHFPEIAEVLQKMKEEA